MKLYSGWMAALVGVSLIGAGCTKQQDDATANAASNAADSTANAAENAADATANAADSAANATANAANAAGNAAAGAASTVTNAGVTGKIKNAINLSAKIKNLASKINVDTTDTTVTLKGGVTSKADSMEAERLAKLNAGTRKVVNQLKVM